MATKITSVSMQDFQSLRGNVRIDFDGLTFLCGPNSAGKSAIIDAIAIIRSFARTVSKTSSIGCNVFPKVKLSARMAVSGEDRFLSSTLHTEKINYEVGRIINDLVAEGSALEMTTSPEGIEYRCVETGRMIGLYFICPMSGEAGSFNISDPRKFNFAIHKDSDERIKELDGEELRSVLGVPDEEPDDFNVYTRLSDEGIVNCVLRASSNLKLWFGSRGLSYEGTDVMGVILEECYDFYDFTDQLSNQIWHFVEAIAFLAGEFSNCSWPRLVPDNRSMLNSRTDVYASAEHLSHWANTTRSSNIKPDPIFRQPTESGEPPISSINRMIKKHFRSLGNYKFIEEEIKQTHHFTPADSKRYINFEEDPVYRYWIQKIGEDTQDIHVHGFEDVGSGISYLFPVLAALVVVDNVVIQQPELHLHPAAQCEVGDALIASLSPGCGRIVETHSEHMILRVLRRIREADVGFLLPEDLKIKPEQVRVLYFDSSPGGTTVHLLRISSSGDFIDPWPRGFFSEREGELFPEGLESYE